MVPVANSSNSSRSVFHHLKKTLEERESSHVISTEDVFTPGLAGVSTSGCISIKREQREGGGEIQEIEFRNCSSFPELFSSLFFVVSHTITPGFPVSVSATACYPSKAFPRKLQTFCPAGVGSVRTSCRCLLSSVRMVAKLPGSDARNMVNVSSYMRTCGRVTPLTPARI